MIAMEYPPIQCRRCKEVKSVSEFGNEKIKSYCKPCYSTMSRGYRDRQRERKGLPKRDSSFEIHGCRKYVCDFSFFDTIDTEPKAYWLGFIAADGCVRNERTFAVSLSAIDKVHLESLRSDLKATYRIYEYDATAVSGTIDAVRYPVVSLTISSSRMVTALGRKGVLPRKTHSLQFPTVDQVPANLRHHFVRGYFDGDGSISASKPSASGARSWAVDIIGPTGFCDALGSLLFPRVISRPVDSKTPNIEVPVDVITIHRRADVLAVRDYLYADATTFLERKKRRFDEVIPTRSKATPL